VHDNAAIAKPPTAAFQEFMLRLPLAPPLLAGGTSDWFLP
jgi:hypothetical protein